MSINSKSGGRISELYAQTLFDLSEEQQLTDAMKSELEEVRVVFDAEKDFWKLMCSPYFDTGYKTALLQKVFSGRLSEVMVSFLVVTVKHDRFRFLPDIHTRFSQLWDNLRGYLAVKVTVSREIDEQWTRNFSDEVASVLNRKINLETVIDPSIIGGIIIRYADKVVDNTVRSRLQNLVRNVTSAEKRWMKPNEIRLE